MTMSLLTRRIAPPTLLGFFESLGGFSPPRSPACVGGLPTSATLLAANAALAKRCAGKLVPTARDRDGAARRSVLPARQSEQPIGAIKMRVEERGGTFAPTDARARAAKVRRERDYIGDRQRLVRDGNWISGVHKAVQATRDALVALAEEISADHAFNISCGHHGHPPKAPNGT